MTLPPMHSPAVMQYITTALGQFPPESLCFLCSKNVLLTHQLLW